MDARLGITSEVITLDVARGVEYRSLWKRAIPGVITALMSAAVVVLDAERRPKPLIAENATNASLSPDGRWLAYASAESGQNSACPTVPTYPSIK